MERNKFEIGKFSAFIFLALMTIIWLFPIIFGFLTSFKSKAEIMTAGFNILPIQWTIENYAFLLSGSSSAPILTWFKNSLVIATATALLTVFLISLAAFAYSRLEFKGKNVLFTFILAAMMFPQVVNLIPLFSIMDRLGWVNSPLAMILPASVGAFNIFLVRQFMDNIPIELDESARVDGATDFQIYRRIILPLSRPILIVVGLFSFTASWNDFLWPSIVFSDIEKMPITPGLELLQGMHSSDQGVLMAGAMIAIIPTFILYLFAQDYFLESLGVSSGVKG